MILYHHLNIYKMNICSILTTHITKVNLEQTKVDMDFRPADGLSNDFDDLEQQNMKPQELLDQMVDKVTHRKDTKISKRQNSPPNQRTDWKSNIRIVFTLAHSFSQKHEFMKMDYQPYLITCNIQNPTLARSLEKAQSLFNKELKKHNIKNQVLNPKLVRQIYENYNELKHECNTMYKAMKDSNVQDCIELTQALHTTIWYFNDLHETAPLWAEIESKVQLNMDILTFKEKVKALYGFNTNQNKKGSPKFLDRLKHNLLQTDFTKLPLNEVFMFKTATKNCYKSELKSRQFIFDLIDEQPDIVETDSKIGLDIAYTYSSGNMTLEQYTNEVSKRQQLEEDQQLMDFLSQPISEQVNLMTDSDLLRLFKIISYTNLDRYPELGLRMTRDILLRIEDIEPDVLIVLLSSLTNVENKRGFGDIQFWDQVSAYIVDNFDKFEALQDRLLFCEMFEFLAHHQILSSEDYHRLFRKPILEWLQSRVLSFSHIASLFNGVMCMDLAFPNTETIQGDLKSIVTYSSSKNNVLTIRHYKTLKIMHMHAKTNHPFWNLKVLGRLLDQFDQSSEFYRYANKLNWKFTELYKVTSFIEDEFYPPMVPVFNEQGAFVIDLANEAVKFAIYLKVPRHILSSSIFEINLRTIDGRVVPERQMQMDILRAQGWHIYELDYLDLINRGDERLPWLLETLKEELQEAKYNREVVNEETRLGS